MSRRGPGFHLLKLRRMGAPPASDIDITITDLIVDGSRWIDKTHAFLILNHSTSLNEYEHQTGGGHLQAKTHDASAGEEPSIEDIGTRLLNAGPGNTVHIYFGDGAGREGRTWQPRGSYGAAAVRARIKAPLTSGLDLSIGADAPVNSFSVRITETKIAIHSAGAERFDVTAEHPDAPVPDTNWHNWILASAPSETPGFTVVRLWRDPHLPGDDPVPGAFLFEGELDNTLIQSGLMPTGLSLNNPLPGGMGHPTVYANWSEMAAFWPAL